MKPEYEKICRETIQSAPIGFAGAIREAIEKCEALAVKPPQKLTLAETGEIWGAFESEPGMVESVYAMVAKLDEIRARPAEPEVVEFDYDKWSKGGWDAINEFGNVVPHLIAGDVYNEMRRKS